MEAVFAVIGLHLPLSAWLEQCQGRVFAAGAALMRCISRGSEGGGGSEGGAWSGESVHPPWAVEGAGPGRTLRPAAEAEAAAAAAAFHRFADDKA